MPSVHSCIVIVGGATAGNVPWITFSDKSFVIIRYIYHGGMIPRLPQMLSSVKFFHFRNGSFLLCKLVKVMLEMELYFAWLRKT